MQNIEFKMVLNADLEWTTSVNWDFKNLTSAETHAILSNFAKGLIALQKGLILQEVRYAIASQGNKTQDKDTAIVLLAEVDNNIEIPTATEVANRLKQPIISPSRTLGDFKHGD